MEKRQQLIKVWTSATKPSLSPLLVSSARKKENGFWRIHLNRDGNISASVFFFFFTLGRCFAFSFILLCFSFPFFLSLGRCYEVACIFIRTGCRRVRFQFLRIISYYESWGYSLHFGLAMRRVEWKVADKSNFFFFLFSFLKEVTSKCDFICTFSFFLSLSNICRDGSRVKIERITQLFFFLFIFRYY